MDPEGRRTIGVLTKLDLMDKGTNALPVLDNRVYKLKLGYIGVVNRSQADIEAAVPVAEAREAERLFFAQHPAYRSVAHRMGVEFLSKTLNRLLMEHIGAYLPLLISKVNSSITKLQGKIQALGAPLDEQVRAAVWMGEGRGGVGGKVVVPCVGCVCVCVCMCVCVRVCACVCSSFAACFDGWFSDEELARTKDITPSPT